MKDVLLTDINSVSPYFGLLSKIRSRNKSIVWQARTQKQKPAEYYTSLEALGRMEDALLVIIYTKTKSWRYRAINRTFKKLGNTEQHIMKIFGAHLKPGKNRNRDPVEELMLKKMARSNRIKRVSELQTRILLELIEKQAKGWYTVFNTLTVANEYYTKTFEKDNRVFEKYILALNYAVKKETEKRHGKQTGPTGNFHTYFAVVEKGGKKGRLHFHILHCFRELPHHCRDPNYGRSIPSYRIIAGLRRYWKYGFSTPIAVRMDSSDNYALAGWRWPVKRIGKNVEAIETSNTLRMARYMAKYITKADEERIFRWRTRLSKGYGTSIIRQSICAIPLQILERHLIKVTMWKHLQIMDITIPMILTRKLAMKAYLHRKSLSSKGSKVSTLQKSVQNMKPRHSIVEQYRTLMRTKQNHSLQSIGYIQTEKSKKTDIFNIQQAFKDVLTKYNYHKIIQPGRGATWQ